MKAIDQHLDYRLPAHTPLYWFWWCFVKTKIFHGFVMFGQRKLMFLQLSKNPNQACTKHISPPQMKPPDVYQVEDRYTEWCKGHKPYINANVLSIT